jgi:DNA-binding protein Fis
MITILISEDEARAKGILEEILGRGGYRLPDGKVGENIFKIVRKDGATHPRSVKDTVIELENTLHKEKEGVLYKAVLEAVERPLIEHVLEKTNGNQLKASKILGINRNTIRAKIKRLGIDVGTHKA